MGLGSKEKEPRIYYMSMRGTKNKVVNAHFRTQVREPGAAIVDLPDETKVSGLMRAVGHNEYEFPKNSGLKQKTIIIYLVDGDDHFKVESNIDSVMGRSLMNSLLGTKDFDNLKISLRVKNEMPAISVFNNDQKTEWKYDYTEKLKPMVYEVEDPKTGKPVKVYRKVNELLWNDWLVYESYVAKRAANLGYDKLGTVAQKPATGTKPAEDPGPSLQDEFNAIHEPGQSIHEDDPRFIPPADDLPF